MGPPDPEETVLAGVILAASAIYVGSGGPPMRGARRWNSCARWPRSYGAAEALSGVRPGEAQDRLRHTRLRRAADHHIGRQADGAPPILGARRTPTLDRRFQATWGLSVWGNPR